jgi:hypothetical protein
LGKRGDLWDGRGDKVGMLIGGFGFVIGVGFWMGFGFGRWGYEWFERDAAFGSELKKFRRLSI